MAVLHRALLSWFLGLVFLILLVIRLDNRTQWNWFIVFIPMWIFDVAVMTYAGFYLFSRCRAEPRQICNTFLVHKLHFVIAVVFKMTLQILICLKLEVTSWDLPLYYVFIPLWCILAGIVVTMIHHLAQVAVDRKLQLADLRHDSMIYTQLLFPDEARTYSSLASLTSLVEIQSFRKYCIIFLPGTEVALPN